MCSGLLARSVGLLAVVAACVLALAAGCDASRGEPATDDELALPPDLGGEPLGPREPPGEREIRILSGARVQLGFGDRAELRVLLRDGGGEAAVGERVSFGLRGRSQDASLDRLDAVTDDVGEAFAMLTAGDMAATFDVRMSAAGALDRHVEVAISDSGFGSLRVEAPYAGKRDVRERVIVVQADTRCDELERSAGDPSFTLLGEQARADFLALPAETRYAVAGFAQGSTGVVLAKACVEGVRIDADHTRHVELEWSDAALVPAEQLRLELVLDARAPASWLGAVLSRAAEDAVTLDVQGGLVGSDAEARFLLGVLDATLRGEEYADEDGAVELADALVRARADAGGTLERSLRSLLVVNDEGPLRAIDELADRTKAGLERVEVEASVGIESVDGDYALQAWTLQLTSIPQDGMSPASVILPAAQAMSLGYATRVAGADALEVDALRLRVALGALAAKLLKTATEVDADDDPEAPMAQLGCATLQEWLQKQLITGSEVCDEDCYVSVCARAMTRLLAMAEPALIAVDERRPEVRLAGTLVLDDQDGDLLADVIDAAQLEGEWLPAPEGGSGAAVSGSGQATAVAVAE